MRVVVFTMFLLASCSPSMSTPVPICGDGIIEGNELCDASDVRDVTCAALGLGPGVVRCSTQCDRLDVSGCSMVTSIDAGVTDSGVDAGLDAGFDAGIDAGLDAGIDAGPSRLLHVSAGALRTADGAAIDVRGAVSCCGGGYGWPLINEEWVDLVASHRGNFLHARLGPFNTQNANGETDWSTTGGGYVEVNGLADLTQFNPVFWARVRALLTYARDRGMWVELDVIDGWGIKHCKWGDIAGYSAWDSAFNVQHVDGCTGTGSSAIAPGSLQDAWIRKVVTETGEFDNVIYQDGNEIGIVGGYAPAWSTSLANIIHDEETRHGFARHLVGSNSGDATTMSSAVIDYGELHQNGAATSAQCGGKPCLVNEYNPDPPLTADQFHARVCAARSAGTWFWYWRHGQSAQALAASLSLLDAPCP